MVLLFIPKSIDDCRNSLVIVYCQTISSNMAYKLAWCGIQ